MQKYVTLVVLSDTCDKNREKHDDIRSILTMNTVVLDWFRLSRGVPYIQFLLYYVVRFNASDELHAATADF
jgi:hypothetical protein